MSRQVTWAKHYQNAWEERSGDHRLPMWLRVACLAYGMHKANGHAQFSRGDVSLTLAFVDRETGVITPASRWKSPDQSTRRWKPVGSHQGRRRAA